MFFGSHLNINLVGSTVYSLTNIFKKLRFTSLDYKRIPLIKALLNVMFLPPINSFIFTVLLIPRFDYVYYDFAS